MGLEDPRVFTALLLTSMGAAGTSLGALLVVIHPKMQFKRLGFLQGLAAGLMLSISVFDLFQESQEAVGNLWANVWFFAGVAFFAAVVAFIPEPDSSSLVLDDDDDNNESSKTESKSSGTSTAVAEGTAKLRPGKSTGSGPPQKESSQARQQRREAKKRVLMSGLITAVGIALHNFPEGVAVFLASMKSQAIGLSLALAIALHNVPEGVAVALPVYFATGSRWKGFKYAFVSGLAEPAAVVVLALLFPSDLDKRLIDCLLAAVGGIMAFLAISELLPLAIEHAGRQQAVLALFLGMALMSANMYILDEYIAPGHHAHAHTHEHEH